MIRSCVVLLVICTVAVPAAAQVPRTISYQGVLKDANTQVIVPDGNYQLTFKLYTDPTQPPEVWTESQTVAVVGGVFNAILGTTNPLNIGFDTTYWLGVTVDSDPELTPRIQLSSSPYSLNARTVEDGAITGPKIATGQVVKSLNSLTDDVTLEAGPNVTISPSGNTLTISSSSGGAGDGHSLDAADGDPVDAVFVDDDGEVGIGTAVPETSLHLIKAGDHIRMQLPNRPASYSTISDQGYSLLGISKVGSSGNVTISITPKPSDGTSAARVRMFRSTNTAGGKSLRLYKGDNTPTVHAQVGVDGEDSYFQIGGGKLGIGTSAPQSKLHVDGRTETNTLQINGGADLAEPFEMSGTEPLTKGSVVVIDPDSPGKLKLSDRPYDRRVAGVVSGAGGVNAGLTLSQEGVLDRGQNVAIGGRVYVMATASNGPIQAGDLLTTSEIPGRAMRVDDHDQSQGAIIGKAMSNLDEGEGLVLVLISLQ